MTEKNPTRAEQRAKRLAQLQAEMAQLHAEQEQEAKLNAELPTRGLARSRAAVALYELLDVSPVRRDDDDEKRASKLVQAVALLAKTPVKPDVELTAAKEALRKVEQQHEHALLTIANLRNVPGDRNQQLASARAIVRETLTASGAAPQRMAPSA